MVENRYVVPRSDSESAICLFKNQVFNGRTKHIEVRYRQIRHWLNSGVIKFEKVHI